MLRESMLAGGKQVDVAGVTQGFDEDVGIPYTSAAQGRDAPEIRSRAGVNDFPRVQHPG